MSRGMTRREWLAMAGAGVAAGPFARGAAAENSAPPNVLFIAVDDMNDWITPLGGHPDAITPNLERLAKRGVVFTNAHCSAPACNPSRASLLSGLLPSTTGVYLNHHQWRPAMPDAVTLPRHFMDNGYHVMGGGKIFHGGQNDKSAWHEYFPQKGDPLPEKRPLHGIPGMNAHFDWGPVDCTDDQMADGKLINWAEDALKKDYDRPFFLGVGIFRPHLPWYAPQKYFDLYSPDEITLPTVKDDDLDDVPPMGRHMALSMGDHATITGAGENKWREAVASYLACITFADAMIGRVLDALDTSPYVDNTIIVMWADHGWHLGEKLHWRKFALWEEATRNPLMFVVPGLTRPGARCAEAVNLIDIYPTLIDLCSLPHKDELEGLNLLPQLKDTEAARERPALTTHGYKNHSIRSERWRYIRYEDGTEELYDHSNDEMEWTNLAAKPELGPVKERLAKWLPQVNAPDPLKELKKQNREEATNAE